MFQSLKGASSFLRAPKHEIKEKNIFNFPAFLQTNGYATKKPIFPNHAKTFFKTNQGLLSADGCQKVKFNNYPEESLLTLIDLKTGDEEDMESIPLDWDIQDNPASFRGNKGPIFRK